MTEKNSNRISLIIAILAIVLIIGGLYVLQRSLSTNSSKSSANSSKTISTQKSNGSKTTTVTPSTTSSNQNIDNTSKTTAGNTSTVAPTTAPTTADPVTTPAAPKVEPVKQVPTTTGTPQPGTTTASTAPKVALNQNELTAKYIGNNTFEIVDCGKTGGSFCKSPYKVYINNQVANNVGPLTNDKTYKFNATWNEDANGILFSNIQTIVEVK
jgi:cytoskeletal protein RodZ